MKSIKSCSILLLLLSIACRSSYKSEQHLCQGFYLVEHESANGHSLFQRTGQNELSEILIEGDITEVSGNSDYIFAKQSYDSYVFYYLIDTHHPSVNQASPIDKSTFDTKLSKQKVEYYYHYSSH